MKRNKQTNKQKLEIKENLQYMEMMEHNMGNTNRKNRQDIQT